MVKLVERKDKKTGEVTLAVDKRTLPKTNNPPNLKDLRYARNLPAECNNCPYRSQEEGGNGICKKYEKDALCVIRKDISKMIDEFSERNSLKVVDLMEAEFQNNFELLQFFEQMENQKSELDPEVTRRINSLTNLGKVINEIKTKKQTIEVTQKETLSEDLKHQIANTLKLTREFIDEP